MAANIVYFLCASTALACAVLLWRGWAQTKVSLIFWNAICFSLLFVNNTLLFLDQNVGPGIADFHVARSVSAFAGVTCLVYGLVKEEE